MNIGLLTYTLSDRSGARAPIRLAQALKKAGHQVTIYGYDFNQDKELTKKLNEQGIKVVIYQTNPSVPFSFRGWGSVTKAASDLKKSTHDVISFHSTLPFMIAAKLSGVKVLKTYYGTELSYYQIRRDSGMPIQIPFSQVIKSKIFDYLLMFLEKLSFMFADQKIAISKFLADEARQLYGEKIDYIYLGAQSDFFHEQRETKNEDNFILSVSRIVPYKGFDLLIEAFKKADLKELRLVIVGSTADQSYLEYLKSLKNDKVEIKSNLTDKELAQLYSSCLAYASGDLWVPWTLTPLEASFFGKPLIGFDLGAMNEVIKNNENGLLARNVDELSENISKIAKSKDLRHKLGSKAKEKVKEFTWERTVSEYEQRFKSL